MALSYSEMFLQSQDQAFVHRVEFAILQEAANNKLEALPAAATDVTQAAQEDRLARAIIANPSLWATKFALLVAIQLIAKATLLDEAVTTDADIFSAVAAVYDKFLTG